MPSGLRRGWVACRGDLTGFSTWWVGFWEHECVKAPCCLLKSPSAQRGSSASSVGKAPGISEDAESLGSGNEPRFLQLLVQDEQTSLSQEPIYQ